MLHHPLRLHKGNLNLPNIVLEIETQIIYFAQGL